MSDRTFEIETWDLSGIRFTFELGNFESPKIFVAAAIPSIRPAQRLPVNWASSLTYRLRLG